LNSIKSLSIITVNLDDKSGLSRTVESVKSQNFHDFEFIIIDGGSKDGSLEVIKENETLIDYWVSEKDSGIYNAMNKGINKASGKYILFLNSGDYLLSKDALSIDFKTITQDIVYGHLTHNNNNVLNTSAYKDNIDLGFFFVSTLPHGSTFIRRELFLNYGLYKTDYIIVSDWIFFLERIVIDSCSTLNLNKAVSVFTLGGISTRPENKDLVKQERVRFLNTIMPSFAQTYIQSTITRERNSKQLEFKNKALQSSLIADIDNLKRLKGLKMLKQLNNVINFCYKRISR
jgi:glycosyltransferase involved in cell wall biosynthesis